MTLEQDPNDQAMMALVRPPGWSVRPQRLGYDERATPAVGHGGSTLGGRASLLILPESGMVVSTMTNARGARVNMGTLSGYVASFFRNPEMIP